MELKGTIKKVEELQEKIPNGEEDLGVCWVARKTSPPSNRDPLKPTVLKARRILVPAKDQEFLSTLVEAINNAHEVICLSSFMIEGTRLTDALLKAAKRGVRVYILTAEKDDLKRAEDDLDNNERENIEKHKALLDSMAGPVLTRTSGHFHAKFLLVDPKSAEAVGYLMTCNATAGAMTGNNLEVAATLTRDEIKSYHSQFILGFWGEAKNELFEKNQFEPAKAADIEIKQGAISHPSTCSTSKSLKQTMIEMIRKSKKYLVITGWSFDRDHEVTREVSDALDRGVKVAVYTRPNVRNTEALADLCRKGAEVNAYDRYHAKIIIFDNAGGIITTSNFTVKGLDEGFEAAIKLSQDEEKHVASIMDAWDGMCGWTLNPGLRVKDAAKNIMQYKPGQTKLLDVTVEDSVKKQLPQPNFTSCDQVLAHDINPKLLANLKTGDSTKKYREIIAIEKVVIPTLPNAAKERSDVKGPYPLFSGKDGKTYVVVKTWEDVNNAKEFAIQNKARIVIKV